MNNGKQSTMRTRRIGFCHAAILVLALMGWAGAQPPGGGGEGRHEGGVAPMETVSPRMMRDLHLTADQEKKMKESRLLVQKKQIQMRSDKAMLELDLKNVLSTYPVNMTEAMKLGEKVADIEQKMIMLKVESWGGFLAGLTAEQHRKLMDIQADLKEKRKAWRDDSGKDHKDRGPDDMGGPGPGP